MTEQADAALLSLYMRLYFDEDVSVEIATNLTARGFDVLTVRDAGRRQLADEAQLAFAAQEQRSLVTHNRADFELLHEQYVTAQHPHFGIIIAKRRPHDDIVVRKLLSLLDSVSGEEMRNQLRYI
jgi:predicted nuclease of predicted toxin-antitoxin system